MRPSPSPVIVGRVTETGALCGLVRRTAAGAGGLAWLEGEPGIGKTTVLTSCVRPAEESGFRILWSEADELTAQMPLQVLLDALRGDERKALAAPLRGDDLQGTEPVLATIERLWAHVDQLCTRTPVLWVLDELHRADDATLLAWRGLLRSAAQQPLLLVCAGEPVPQHSEISRLRRAFAGAGGLQLSLTPLAPAEAAILAAHLSGTDAIVSDVVERSGGNPLYIREMVDALKRDRAGGSLSAAISSRVQDLSAETLRMLRMAALQNRTFTAFELATVTGSTVIDLAGLIDEALAAGVLAESDSKFVFRHGVIRLELYESIPASLRAALHQQAARALGDSGAPLEQVVEQLLATPDVLDDWTIQWLSDRGEALGRRAPGVAVQLLQRALRQLGDADPRRQPLERVAADVLRLQLRSAELATLAEQAVARAGDAEHAARMTWARLIALLYLDPAKAIEVAEEELTNRTHPLRWTARLRAQYAVLLAAFGRLDDAAAVARQAQSEGEQADDRYAVGCALHAMALASSNVDTMKTLELCEQAAEILSSEPEALDLRLVVMHNMAEALVRLGRGAEADRLMQQTIALAEWGGVAAPSRFRIDTAQYYFTVGRWDDALAELESVDEIPEHTQLEARLRATTARILAHRGDPAGCERVLAPLWDRVWDRAAGDRDELVLAQALAHDGAGRPEQARDLLARRLGAQAGPDQHIWLPHLVRLALEAGDHDTAAVASARADADAGDGREPAKAAAALRCRALLDGDPAPALRAADHYRSAGQPLDLAHALEDASVLAGLQGDQQAAGVHLAEALDIYASLGAAWDIRRAETRSRAHGVRRTGKQRRDRPHSGWESLTPAEVKIAHLVAQGLSNPDIAAQLFLSRRTVQTHVSHILAKLAVPSRAGIAEEVARRGDR